MEVSKGAVDSEQSLTPEGVTIASEIKPVSNPTDRVTRGDYDRSKGNGGGGDRHALAR